MENIKAVNQETASATQDWREGRRYQVLELHRQGWTQPGTSESNCAHRTSARLCWAAETPSEWRTAETEASATTDIVDDAGTRCRSVWLYRRTVDEPTDCCSDRPP